MGTSESSVSIAYDREVLAVLYEAMGGSEWRRSDGWFTDSPLDQWYGLSTRGHRVVGIDLADNLLTGAIPQEIGYLTGLEHLNLLGNSLSGELPYTLGNLSGLTYLDVRWNAIGGHIPRELGDIDGLETLLLGGNKLTSALPWELGRLQKLVRLDVSRNNLEGEIPAELGWLPNLEILAAQHNRLVGHIPWQLGEITSLKRLLLSGNELAGIVPPELDGLRYAAHQRPSSIATGVGQAYDFLEGETLFIDLTKDSSSWTDSGTGLLHEVTTNIELPQARLAVAGVMNALVIQNGLMFVRESYIPQWIDSEQLKYIVEGINAKVRAAPSHIASEDALIFTLETYRGETIDMLSAHPISPATLPWNGIGDEIGRHENLVVPMSQPSHYVQFDCSQIKAHNPHYSREEVIKAKTSGYCEIPASHAEVSLTLYNHLRKKRCWSFLCWWSVVATSGPHTRHGPVARWNERTTSVRAVCRNGTYSTLAKICPGNYSDDHYGRCGYRWSRPVPIDCP